MLLLQVGPKWHADIVCSVGHTHTLEFGLMFQSALSRNTAPRKVFIHLVKVAIRHIGDSKEPLDFAVLAQQRAVVCDLAVFVFDLVRPILPCRIYT